MDERRISVPSEKLGFPFLVCKNTPSKARQQITKALIPGGSYISEEV